MAYKRGMTALADFLKSIDRDKAHAAIDEWFEGFLERKNYGFIQHHAAKSTILPTLKDMADDFLDTRK